MNGQLQAAATSPMVPNEQKVGWVGPLRHSGKEKILPLMGRDWLTYYSDFQMNCLYGTVYSFLALIYSFIFLAYFPS
jgi:hypothetical protein